MDPGKIFQVITNSTLLATRLLSGPGGPLHFTEPRYCVAINEDSPPNLTVTTVTARHDQGLPVRYSITGGNRDGLFTIDQRSGLITLAAPLDYELHSKHELVVTAESEGKTVHSIVQVTVVDVNDNAPEFLETDLVVSVVEEEEEKALPAVIAKVEARDIDTVDKDRLLYSLGGDGVDGHGNQGSFFSINPHTGELLQLRALDRDPPRGRASWKLKVQVRDGQRAPSSLSSWHSRNPRLAQTQQPNSPLDQLYFADKPFLGHFSVREDVRPGDDKDAPITDGAPGRESMTDLPLSHANRLVRKYTSQYGNFSAVPDARERGLSSYALSRGSGVWYQVRRRNGERRRKVRDKNSGVWEEVDAFAGGKREAGDSRMRDVFSSHLGDAAPSARRVTDGTGQWKWESEWNRRKGDAEKKYYSRATLPTSRQQNRQRASVNGKPLPITFQFAPNAASRRSSRFMNYPAPSRKNGNETTETAPSREHRERGELNLGISLSKHDILRSQRRRPLVVKANSGNPLGEWRDIRPRSQARRDVRPRLQDELHLASQDEDGGGCPVYPSTTSNGGESQRGSSGDPRLAGGLPLYEGQDIGYGEELDFTESHYIFGPVHVVETVVTVVVKDINDNAPVFPNTTIYGEVQENGPIHLEVAVVSAWDADDEDQDDNARLTYSIEKNVIDERTGQAIFAVDPETGLVNTAICCLDRETTPEYHIQVVAVDGGGLKGSGTVVVRLVDVNDNSPRLTRELWETEVEETWGTGPPLNATLLEITTDDRDTSNYFFYRVVEASGWGWDHFDIRTVGTYGELYAKKTLDYEDPLHRRGFKFMVQVTDRGRGGWDDVRHTDTAWVSIHLKDLNDNPPEFRRPNMHVTVREDTAPGTLLASMPAIDPDMEGHQRVEYRVVGGWGALTVDVNGGVRLWRALDREGEGGAEGLARVVGVDGGRPPLSSTATLSISVTDVNDCPPRLLPPTVLHVTEGTPATRVGLLTATDDDVWERGHGPPFTLALAASNPPHVLNLLAVRYDASIDSGRGGAEVWTLVPVDREEHRHLTAEVVVRDAGGLAATHPITVIVDDVNDNPMKPGAKTVYLWKIQGGGSDASLGRVYVDDPDDWDLDDKTFAWAGTPHQLFTLNTSTGAIYASKLLREGRYELHFSVSDRVWGQQDVRANVTVDVRFLTHEALAHAVPITLTPTTPMALTAEWTPKRGGGGLGTLTQAVTKVVGDTSSTIEIVSVYGHPDTSYSSVSPVSALHTHAHDATVAGPYACVWLSVKSSDGVYMDPVKLQGLLALHLEQLESIMNVRVAVEDAVSIEDHTDGSVATPTLTADAQDPSTVASLASTALPLQVVDTNSTSLVTPRLTRAHDCRLHARDADESCTPLSCLNGGRCVRTDVGNRCVCPGGASGPRCKVASRSFQGTGWAWVKPLPPCLPTTLSLRLLTRRPHALILYSGPLASGAAHPRFPPTPMMALQLVSGRPQLVMEGARGHVKLQVNTTLNTGTWHTIHVHLNSQGVTLMIDLCGRGWADESSDAHCVARAPWVDPQTSEAWSGNSPLQLGGLAHQLPKPAYFGWSSGPIGNGLDGCISHLTVNGQLVDLGEPAFFSGSKRGCTMQDDACRAKMGGCGFRGECVGGLNKPECSCDPGWAGSSCTTPTAPISLNHDSYIKVALSFTPDPYAMTSQLRVRTRGRPDGVLLQVLDHHRTAAITLRLRAGVACASVSGAALAAQEACVEGFPLGDGAWHTVRLERHGHNLVVSVDDGDGWRRNESLATFLTTTHGGEMKALLSGTPIPILVDKQDCCVVGGEPEYAGDTLVAVNDDLRESCIEDLRVSGHAIPLSVSANNTRWGQVINQRQVEQGCPPPDLCTNTTCVPPLACHNSWAHGACSCGPGQHLVGRSCRDFDECTFKPCLHGGTCYNVEPGYQCACGPAFVGDNCQWAKLPPHAQTLTAPMVIAAVALSSILMVVLILVVTLRVRRLGGGRGITLRCEGVEGLTSATGTPVSLQGDSEYLQTSAVPDENVFLEAIKIKIPGTKLHRLVGKSPPVSHTCTTTLAVDEPLVKEVSVIIPSASTPSPEKEPQKQRSQSISRRCSASSVGDVGVTKRVSLPRTSGSPEGTQETQKVVVTQRVTTAQPLLPQDDLRAYAYEGDWSPSGSLTSTVLGLRAESLEDETVRPLLPEYGEVFDLLRNLPDAAATCTLKKEHASKPSKEEATSPSIVAQIPSLKSSAVKASSGAVKSSSPQDTGEATGPTRSHSFSSLRRGSTSRAPRTPQSQTLRRKSPENSTVC